MLRGANGHMAYLHDFLTVILKGKNTDNTSNELHTHNDSHFTLEALFSPVLLVAETGTGKSLLSLKATENRSL